MSLYYHLAIEGNHRIVVLPNFMNQTTKEEVTHTSVLEKSLEANYEQLDLLQNLIRKVRNAKEGLTFGQMAALLHYAANYINLLEDLFPLQFRFFLKILEEQGYQVHLINENDYPQWREAQTKPLIELT